MTTNQKKSPEKPLWGFRFVSAWDHRFVSFVNNVVYVSDIVKYMIKYNFCINLYFRISSALRALLLRENNT